MSFCHLHLHSEYSLLDGACRVKDIPKLAAENGHTAVAITDHGAMYGAVDFYLACKDYGIKPIIGCEVYVAAGSRFDKTRDSDYSRYHLVLLCKDETGYRNLIYMVSKGFTEGFYTKPRIDLELLREHSEGLICLSACLAGYIPRMISAGEFEKAEKHAIEMDKLFGRGNYYLELQYHGIEAQREVNEGLIDISKRTGIPLVATNDVHYPKKSDAENQAVMLCIQTNSKLSDGRPIGFETDEFYYKSTEEMTALFGNIEGAVDNSGKIADMCNFDFDFSKRFLPRYAPDTGEKPEEFLSRMATEGLEKKIDSGEIVFDDVHTKQTYEERMKYELSVICKMGYSEYYLIVWDFINAAKRMNIPTGPGRGSGAGSLVAYLVGITDVDSIKYNLMFERFLNPERVSMPDFDTDFCYERRDEVIEYVSEKYGKERVCGIITFGTLAAKAVLRDVGRALGMSYADVDAVAKAVPSDLHITLEKAMEGKLGDMYEADENVKKLVDISMALEGMPRHASAHAAGIVITDKPVCDYVPTAVGNGMTLTQFTMDTIAKLGLLKFDFLGLRYLTIISDAEKEIRRTNPDFDIKKVPQDDRETYELISSGHTDGIFQLESGGMRKLLSQMQPRSLEDIIIAISLYRPGPMDSIPTFLENRAHPEKVKYACPQLKSILENTSGCIVYQEQVMQICRDIAGFSFGRADIIRRAMSKKKSGEMEKERHAFIYGEKDSDGNVICTGAVANGVAEDVATEIFDTMSAFASYAFNKSHATAYAYLSYRTAYLKCHYPCQYLASLLTSVLGNMTKTASYIAEAQKSYRIEVLSPDINESFEKYSVVNHNGKSAIRFGLLGIKNVGLSFLSDVIGERNKNGAFASFTDFISRMSNYDINKRQIEALIKSGACDSFGIKRSVLLGDYENITDIYLRRKKSADDGQIDMFSTLDEAVVTESEYKYTDRPELTKKELLSQERESTGMYFSGHPSDEYSAVAERLGAVPIGELLKSEDDDERNESKYSDGDKVTVAGTVTGRTNKQTRTGVPMAFITLEDRYGEIEIIIFPKVLEKYRALLTEGVAIAVFGTVSESEDANTKVIAETITSLLSAGSDVKMSETPKAAESDKPKTLYLRLPALNGVLFDRIKAVLDIFIGSTPVMLYGSSEKKYIKRVGAGADIQPNMLVLLKKLLGEENVVIK